VTCATASYLPIPDDIAWEVPAADLEFVMKHLYEIFEKFPDRSSLWRDSAVGARAARQKALEMAGKSTNEFYAIDLTSGEVLRLDWKSVENRTLAGSVAESQNNNRSSYVH
jgi:hypothetical protein